jgi:hypothetical protein
MRLSIEKRFISIYLNNNLTFKKSKYDVLSTLMFETVSFRTQWNHVRT